MKNYSKLFIESIQKMVSQGKYTKNDFGKPDDLPHRVYVNGAMPVLKCENGVYGAYLYMTEGFNGKDLAVFKEESIGRFYINDWKKMNNGVSMCPLYHELVIDFPKETTTILVREVTQDDFGSVEEFEKYRDIEIGNIYYTIIKAFLTDKETYPGDSVINEKWFEDARYESIISSLMSEDEDGKDEDEDEVVVEEGINDASDGEMGVQPLF